MTTFLSWLRIRNVPPRTALQKIKEDKAPTLTASFGGLGEAVRDLVPVR